MPLPPNIAIAIYLGKCVSNMFQPLAVPGRRIYLLKVLTSGLLFSGEQTAEYSLSSCIQHTQRRNSFQARRGQRGIVQL